MNKMGILGPDHVHEGMPAEGLSHDTEMFSSMSMGGMGWMRCMGWEG